jgi:hypothetical protein
MWNTKCVIIPAVTGATGILTEGLRKNLGAISGKHSIHSLQMTAVLGTTHVMREVLRSKTGSLSGAGNRWFKGRSAGEDRPVARDNRRRIRRRKRRRRRRRAKRMYQKLPGL